MRVMTLDHWLTSNGISAEDFGKTLGFSGQAVRYWRSGSRMPDANVVQRIVDATDGAVSVIDMHETRRGWLAAQQPEAAE